MSIYSFEMSLKEKVSFDLLADFMLSEISFVSEIVMLNNYWGLSESERASTLAFELNYQDGGYKTFLKVHGKYQINGAQRGELAKNLAKKAGCNVAIGDYIHDVEFSTGRFIIYHPEGTGSFAVEEYLDGDFDLLEIKSIF